MKRCQTSLYASFRGKNTVVIIAFYQCHSQFSSMGNSWEDEAVAPKLTEQVAKDDNNKKSRQDKQWTSNGLSVDYLFLVHKKIHTKIMA